MDIELQTKLLKLKGLLNQISHISYTYSQLGKNFSMDRLDDERATTLLKSYNDLLLQVKAIILNYDNEDTLY